MGSTRARDTAEQTATTARVPTSEATEGGPAPRPGLVQGGPGVGATHLGALMAAGGNVGMVQLSRGDHGAAHAGGAPRLAPAPPTLLPARRGGSPFKAALAPKVQANALTPAFVSGWFTALQAPYSVELNAEIGLSWNAALGALGVALYAKGTAAQEDDGRFRTSITIGIRGSVEFNVYVFAAQANLQASYTWGYAFQDPVHFAARMCALVERYVHALKKFLLGQQKEEAAKALDEGAGAARKAADADTRKAWVRLAATPPIEVQKAEAKLEGSVQGVAGDKRREAIGAFLRNQPELLKQFMTGPKAEVALTTAVAWFYRRLDEARPGENDDKAKWQVRRARMQSLAGSLEHQGVKLTITLSEIKGHANPDQDGAYANVKVAKAASKGVSAPWLRVFSVKNAGVLLDTLAAAVPALFATGAGVDKAIDVATRVVAALRKPARALDTTLGAEAGGEVSFEQHLVFEGATWRTQFRRVQLSGQASASLKTPGPAGSTVTAKVGMAGAVTLVEQIGVDTLSYVKTAYDGFRNRGESATDPRFTGPWGAFVTGRLKPRLKLLAERVATPGTNARREAAGTAFLTACDGKKGEAELVTALEADFEAAFVKTQRDPNQGKAPDEMWRDLPRLSSAEAYKLMADPGKMATLPARQLAELVELSLSRWVSSWRDQVPLVNVLIAARRSGQEVALVTAVDFMRLYRGLSWASWKQVAPLLGSGFLARVEQGKRPGYVELFVGELPPSPAHFGIWRNDNIVAALKSLPRLDATQVLRKIRPSVVYHALAGQGSLWGQELFEHTRVREDEERRPQVRR